MTSSVPAPRRSGPVPHPPPPGPVLPDPAEPTRLVAVPTRRLRLPTGAAGLPRDFWVLWSGQLANRLGTFVEPFLVLYLTRERGLSVAEAGAVLTVFGAGSLVSQPLGGVLADRVGRRPTLVLGLLSNAAAVVLLGLARPLPLVVGAAVLTGLTVDLYRPAAQALVADLVAAPDRQRAFAVLFWAVNLGFAVGTSLAGLLAAHGYWLLFAGDALTTTVAAVVVARGIREPARPPPPPAGGQPSVAGLRVVLRDRLLLAVTGLTLVFASVYGQVFATLPLAVRDAGLGPRTYGLIIGLNGLLIVVAQPLVLGWLSRRRRTAVLAVSQATVGIGFGLTAFAHTGWALALTVVVWTAGEIGTAGVLNAVVAGLAPPHLRGRYQGVYGLAWGGAGALAPALGTLVYGGLGPGWLWGGCAVAGLGLAAGQVALGRALSRREEPVGIPLGPAVPD